MNYFLKSPYIKYSYIASPVIMIAGLIFMKMSHFQEVSFTGVGILLIILSIINLIYGLFNLKNKKA